MYVILGSRCNLRVHITTAKIVYVLLLRLNFLFFIFPTHSTIELEQGMFQTLISLRLARTRLYPRRLGLSCDRHFPFRTPAHSLPYIYCVVRLLHFSYTFVLLYATSTHVCHTPSICLFITSLAINFFLILWSKNNNKVLCYPACGGHTSKSLRRTAIRGTHRHHQLITVYIAPSYNIVMIYEVLFYWMYSTNFIFTHVSHIKWFLSSFSQLRLN